MGSTEAKSWFNQGNDRYRTGDFLGAIAALSEGNGGRVLLPPELASLSDRHFQHPYYWAGFTAIGSPW
ncbi:hypothetical protein [Spirulina sp. 06S082]|uniref:hypothetical protein n=1 Tax=Spirulina sp. 06S082 TaxID=3110248 RepID=UPI002B1F40CD|nr:hypothetical protein [Spirulina sp. 06S082]MEA5467726.1 hypothetical protein [Spirulina sp. 06S082]